MRYALAKQGIENARQRLRPITQGENVIFDDGIRAISWINRKTGVMKGTYYPLEYQRLIDMHQYSLLMTDGSFFQFFYEFDNADVLLHAKLAYYPRPIDTRDGPDELIVEAEEALNRDDDLLYQHLFNWTELLESGGGAPTNTSHIRFDYDRNVTTHAPAHLQFGGVQNFRLPANFCPLPLAFVQMCQALVSNLGEIDSAVLGFERNHALQLADHTSLIKLSN